MLKTAALLVITGTILAAAYAALHSGAPVPRSTKEISPTPTPAVVATGRPAVLVELFTSEGCSSCPSADAALADLVTKQPVAGAEVVALSEHVDYWNHNGWADPFSSAQFSDRQRAYSRSLNIDNIYTPQMIVDGEAQFTGSDRARASVEIARSSKFPKLKIALTRKGRELTINIPAASKRADVFLAITEDNLTSQVAHGENSGRKLAHWAVTRSLERLGELAASTAFQVTLRPMIDPKWDSKNLKAVVFIQIPGPGLVLGASVIRL